MEIGDINQTIYLKKYFNQLKGPFLEVGSKDYGSTQKLRSFVRNKGQYIGIDLEAEPGVDKVLNLTSDFDEVSSELADQRFGCIFCLAVLEHCEQPFKMVENLTHLLNDDGKLFISVLFSWKVHAYHNDYWQFTFEGIKKLFPDLTFTTIKR